MVARDAMDRLAEGFHPTQEGVALCGNAGRKPTLRPQLDHDGKQKVDKNGKLLFEERGGHRIGYDVTFSAPKDISLAYQVANEDERATIAAAHKAANRAAMAYLENLIETRRGHAGRDVIQVDGLIWSSHMHLDARPSKDADPQCSLHSHNLVYGVARGADGRWASFEYKEFFDNRFASDAVYKNALYQGMRALGYKLEQTEEHDISGQTTGAKATRLAGFTDNLIEHFSARKGEILGYMHEHQVDKQTAWARTRQQKGQTEYEVLSEWWDIDMKAYQGQHPNEQRLTTQGLKEQTEHLLKPASLDEIVARLHEHDALLEKRDVMTALADEVMGRVSSDALYAATTRATEQLVPVAPHAIHVDDAGRNLARRHTADRYAAPWMLHQERAVQEHTRRRMEEDRRLSPDYVTKVIADYEKRKGFSLSDEQRSAVHYMCCETGGIAVQTGFAGSGKTTVAEVFVEAYRGQGYHVFGCAPSWAAAQKLEREAGIKSYALASMLKEMEQGRWEGVVVPHGAKSLIIMDEAGMADSKDTRDLLERTERMGMIPKLIMQGDLRQIQPVGAGSGMALVTNESGDVKLTEIRRQRGATIEETQARRALAALFYEQKTDAQGKVVGITDDRHVKSRAEQQAKGARITKALHRHGMLEERSTRAEAKEALLDEWAACNKPLSEKLMLAHTNADVAALNSAARGYLKSNGQLAEKDHQIRVKTGTGKAARFAVMPFAEGESIKFRAKNASLGVVNNSTGTIERIKEARDGSFDLTVRINALTGKDRQVTFNTSKDYNAIATAYCRTIHDAQGQGASQIFHLAHAGMLDNQSALVAFTRLTTGSYTMYGDSTTMEMLESRLGVDRLKETAVLTKGGVQAAHTARSQAHDASAQLMQAFDGTPTEPPVHKQAPQVRPDQQILVRRHVHEHGQSL